MKASNMSNQNSPFTSGHTMVPNSSFKFFFSKKFMGSLKGTVSFSIKELKETHPDWTLVEVVAFIMSDVNKKLTAPMVSELVQHIIAKWENSEVETQEEVLLEVV
jgi:hypothetical protein